MFVFATVTPRSNTPGIMDLSVLLYKEESVVRHNFMCRSGTALPSTDRSLPGYELALSLLEKAIEHGIQAGNRLEYDLLEETV